MVRNDIDIACNCIPIDSLLFGTHTFNFNCFSDDFNCVFTQIRCLSRLLKSLLKVACTVIYENYLMPYFVCVYSDGFRKTDSLFVEKLQ